MDEKYIQDFERMNKIIDDTEAGETASNDDIKWVIGEFTDSVQLLGNAIADVNAHCRMLHNLCVAVVDGTEEEIRFAVAEAVDYHAENGPETKIKSNGFGGYTQ